ncbi:MAG TPA: formyltransferase family protein [Vicinamibacterales bacterium]|nr:formyltransferase family protein [Vicinamibacterales bacterium]
MFAALARRWQQRGVVPTAVVVEAGRASRVRRRLSQLRHRQDDSAGLCGRLGWPVISVTAINDSSAVAAVARTAPDVAVNAGAGILHKPILGLPTLGTLGTHMGVLPAYRGMNVAEWAAFNGDPVGCSVFWIDDGIDTGDIAATRVVDAAGCRTIEALRGRVNEAQLDLYAETLAGVLAHGRGAPRPQAAGEGRQFYRMHADLRALLERRLAASHGGEASHLNS